MVSVSPNLLSHKTQTVRNLPEMKGQCSKKHIKTLGIEIGCICVSLPTSCGGFTDVSVALLQPQAACHFKADSSSRWVATVGARAWPTEAEEGDTNSFPPASGWKPERCSFNSLEKTLESKSEQMSHCVAYLEHVIFHEWVFFHIVLFAFCCENNQDMWTTEISACQSLSVLNLKLKYLVTANDLWSRKKTYGTLSCAAPPQKVQHFS